MATPTELQQLYLAYFGRPADPGGIAYYATTPVASVVKAFSASPEAQAMYGSTFTAASVNAIYMYLFNRPAATSEANAWVAIVNAPRSPVGPAAAALTILQGAQNADRVSVSNKLAVAAAFTASIDTAQEMAGYAGTAAADLARKFLAGVSAAPASVPLATGQVDTQLAVVVAAGPHDLVPVVPVTPVTPVTPVVPPPAPAPGAPPPPPPPPAGPLYVLTTNSDAVTGSAADDTITGTSGTGATFTAADVITGGGGTDTLLLTTDNSFDVYGSNVTNIERLAVTNVAGTTRTVTTFGVTSLTEVINNGSAAGSALVFDTLAAPANVTVLNVTSDTTAKVQLAALTGSADAVTLTLSNVKAPTPAVTNVAAPGPMVTLTATAAAANEFESLTINSAGATPNSITLATDAVQTSLALLTITGATALTLRLATGDNITTSATTIDASAASGGVTIGGDGPSISLGAANHHITLGAGNDTVFFGANLDGNDAVDGGGGHNTLGLTAAVTDAMMAQVSHFDTLLFDINGRTIAQDAGIASLAGYKFALDGYISPGSASFTNLANQATITVQGDVGVLSGTLGDGSGPNDTLNLEFTYNRPNGMSSTGLVTLTDVAGLETLNLVSDNVNHVAVLPTTTNFLGNDGVTARQVLTGDFNLSVSSIVTASFDASAFTGNLTLTTSNTATNLKGGSGNDNLTLGKGANVVDAGAGNDTITLTRLGSSDPAGADVITTGAGNDTVNMVTNSAFVATGGATDYSAFARVTDFHVGSSAAATDLLGFSASDQNYSLRAANDTGTRVTGLARGTVSQGLLPSDAIVLQAVAQGASAAATANVSLFKFTTDTAFSTDVKGTFAAALGGASITGLAANGNYLVSLYDSTHQQAVIAVVNAGGSGEGDTNLGANDFNDAGVAILGVLDMSSGDYASLGAVNFAPATGF